MPFTPVAGAFAACEIEGTTDIAMPGFNWTMNLAGNHKETDNWRDGVQTHTTLSVASGRLQIHWDQDAPPALSANGNLRPGTALTLNLYTDASKTANKSFVVQARVTDCELANNSTKDHLVYNVDWRQHGTLTYPSA